jgi:hypothetical protein
MADDKIEIEIVLDDGSIKKGFATLKKEASTVGDTIKKGFVVGSLTEFNSGLELVAKGLSLVKRSFELLAKPISESIAKEDTINRFNFAVLQSGQISRSAASGFISYADSLERSSKFSGDFILENAALIQSIAQLDSQGLKVATKSAIDLSSALGLDLAAASTLVAKAANGNTEAFKRYGIEIKKGSTDAESFKNTLDELNKRFGGAAQASITSFGGQLNLIGKEFGNILGEIGKFVTQSPAINAALTVIIKAFRSVTESFSGFGSQDLAKNLIINFSLIAQAGIQTALDIGRFFEQSALRAQQAWAAFKVLSTAGLSDAFNQQLDEINQKIEQFNQIDPQDSGAILFFDELIAKVQATNGQLTEMGANIQTNIPTQVNQGLQGIIFKFGELQKVSLDVSQQIRQGFANAASQGIQAFVKAIRSGQNALSAFGKAILGVFGDLAIQIGTTLIAAGLGMSALFELNGPKAIIAGAALIAIGSILKSLSGGEGASSAVGGGINGAGGNQPTAPNTVAQPEIQERSTRVDINVAGTVLDPIGVGQQIAQILNDTFDATGTKVVTV